MRTNRTQARCYAFRREDNGKVVWVDWPTMMEQKNGFITLPDGVEAKRAHGLEGPSVRAAAPFKRAVPVPVVSDNLGFTSKALKEKKAQLKALQAKGVCRSIEFRRDPKCPTFYQVHAPSEAARDEYAKCRGMVNRTGSLGGGLMLSDEDLERAAELVSR